MYFLIVQYRFQVFLTAHIRNSIHCRATEFNPTNPSKKLKLDIPGFGDASLFMKAAKLDMDRSQREVRIIRQHSKRVG